MEIIIGIVVAGAVGTVINYNKTGNIVPMLIGFAIMMGTLIVMS